MKGVIYARYSSDNQREESIEGQLRECKEYAERNDITILLSRNLRRRSPNSFMGCNLLVSSMLSISLLLCFDPQSPLNEKLKQTLLEMMEVERK